ncbi:WxL domain-containing protein [Vagococcus zengguangii]|uniref:WxL domain-containing protein n=1 Tax=Vagococcus zengguangii TaxID=2571750 RepID=A0A4D7CVF8_9ENTE|nr:WxL domain-containing protein [Vagococcus zengguangii]QCI86287.1 WxL domain-containing protein [Vagococcus zengguangii]QCI86719.1 WxL domain-containing protein [Vagococcus zengguangii]
MKNKLINSLLLSSLLLSTVSTVVLADDNEGPVSLSKDASVEFQADDTPTPPVDPENPDPEKPVIPVEPTDPDPDPEKPVEPGTGGELSIDYVSSFYFGVNKITGKTENYAARAQRVFDETGELSDVPNYAQVTDKRGTLAGWTLSVTQATEFQTSEETPHVLVGAQLSLNNAYYATKSDVKDVSLLTGATTLSAGQEVEVLGTSEGQGAGTFTYYMGSSDSLEAGTLYVKNEAGEVVPEETMLNPDVNLKVPGKAVIKTQKYSTDLIWTLKNTPANL